MITIAVVDLTAEGRTSLVERISSYLRDDPASLQVVPRVDLRPLSLQELKFSASPDVCIVGREIVEKDLVEIATIRQHFPDAAIIVEAATGHDLSVIEHVARLGGDDTISAATTAVEFFRKIILLTKRGGRGRKGTLLVVDGGKGGVGVTTIAAGLAEAILEKRKRATLVDFDFETQDLSRFLQAKPFVNENLSLLLSQNRPVMGETVKQCLVQLWADEEGFSVMPPPAESDELYDSRSPVVRTFISIFEVLDSQSDVVIVDAGSIRGAFRQSLYRVADRIVFVMNNDPATLYSSVDRVSRAAQGLGADNRIAIVENCSSRHGLSEKLLRNEFLKASRLDDSSWCERPIPFCRLGSRWPGSGGSIYSQGRDAVSSALDSLLVHLGLVEAVKEEKPRIRFPFVFKRRAVHEEEAFAEPHLQIDLNGTGEKKPLALPIPISEPTLDARSFISGAKVL